MAIASTIMAIRGEDDCLILEDSSYMLWSWTPSARAVDANMMVLRRRNSGIHPFRRST